MPSSKTRVAVVAIAFAALAADARADEALIVRGLGLSTFGTSKMTDSSAWPGLNLSDVLQVTFDASREFGRADPYQRRSPR
jgi:hypothetical protein